MRGDFAMKNGKSGKYGFTLVEVLVIVVIMGILSSMGVASLTGAVKNARIRDYALNTAAFLERAANDANRMSEPVCVKAVYNVQKPKPNGGYEIVDRLTLWKNSCDKNNTSDDDEEEVHEYDFIEVEHPSKIGCDIDGDIESDRDMPNWKDGVSFVPRIGLSAAPTKGFICIQYGSNEIYGLAGKSPTKNMIESQWKAGGGIWQDL